MYRLIYIRQVINHINIITIKIFECWHHVFFYPINYMALDSCLHMENS